MNIEQIKALGAFMETLEGACVENSIILGTESVTLQVADGRGGTDRAIVWQHDDEEDEGWHLEATVL